MSDKKFKHLDFIHNTINRMSTNSFIIKGWTISIVSILFIFSDREMNHRFLGIAIFAVALFWYLNSFFLQQERKFRGLYDKVRGLTENEIDFSMSTSDFNKNRYTFLSAVVGKTIWPLYLSIIIMIILAQYIIGSTVANNVYI